MSAFVENISYGMKRCNRYLKNCLFRRFVLVLPDILCAADTPYIWEAESA